MRWNYRHPDEDHRVYFRGSAECIEVAISFVRPLGDGSRVRILVLADEVDVSTD